MIGYDILTHAWVNFHQEHSGETNKMTALDALEEIARESPAQPTAGQAAQRRYFEELRGNGNPWRVTDFVTLGSPLTHAAILLASDIGDLQRKQADREFPQCLPALETSRRDGIEWRRFSYELNRRQSRSYRLPHHAAVFGPTRWTNLYFPCKWAIRGDLIGGPLSATMGRGIRDVPVTTRQRFGFFSHTLYWSSSPDEIDPPHIAALREALDLTDQRSGNEEAEHTPGEQAKLAHK